MVKLLAAPFSKPDDNEKQIKIERDELLKAADSVRDELNRVHCRLNYTTEPLLIDSIIYEIKALQKRYEYYIKLCKEKGFAAEGFGKIS